MPRRLSKKEERKWVRLHIAIPVFVRSSDEIGEESLEFATAIDISPAGAMVVVRRSLPKLAPISLEIPSAPFRPVNGLKASARVIQAKAVWVAHRDDFHLLGLKFTHLLSTDAAAASSRRLRKTGSAV